MGLDLGCYTQAFLHCSPVGATSCCGAWLIAAAALPAEHRLSGVQALVAVARGLCSCGAQAPLVHGMWDLLRPRIEPTSPALAGVFFTAESPGKPSAVCFCSVLSAVARAPFPLNYPFQALHPVPSYFTSRFSSSVFLVKPSLTPQQISGTCLLYFYCTLYVSSYFLLTGVLAPSP